jgi:hypothetical protein
MIKKRNYRSDYLFAKPSFLIGMGSVFNIGGNYFSFNNSYNDSEADAKAMQSDWGVVGLDIESAVENLKRSIEQVKSK